MDTSQAKANRLPVNPEKWVDEHGDMLYRYALWRVSDETVAEDLVQDTFLSALRALSDYQGESAIRTWLVSILKRKIIDHYRHKSRINAHEPDHDFHETADFFAEGAMKGRWRPDAAPRDWRKNPEAEIETEGFMQVLHACMKKLSDGLAAVFTLRELEQMETESICKELDITASNLWVRLHRARLQLRKCLERNWLARENT
ncbi:MAG TPA: sigma-70 family RNA polymerase sigma factor [bacterium]|nr:sigma-70 family RNA polymerase sigma factor [bacterium]